MDATIKLEASNWLIYARFFRVTARCWSRSILTRIIERDCQAFYSMPLMLHNNSLRRGIFNHFSLVDRLMCGILISVRFDQVNRARLLCSRVFDVVSWVERMGELWALSWPGWDVRGGLQAILVRRYKWRTSSERRKSFFASSDETESVRGSSVYSSLNSIS